MSVATNAIQLVGDLSSNSSALGPQTKRPPSMRPSNACASLYHSAGSHSKTLPSNANCLF
ncbi:hypothetical protein [Tunturiibacter gelidiferens]|uniref:hypothetical protein n=1 Tax=Tunturiibacter gelidiferens TaxID=3069689 RepID=UPI003D9BB7C9